ncbi:MAG: RDD family protein [Pseudomonadota bacterium]
MHLPDPDTQPDFYAGVPAKRLLAWVVDTVLVIALVLLALPFTAFTGLFFLPFLFLCLSFAYRFVTLASGSSTWGMHFAAIELRDETGARLDGSAAFFHTLGYIVSVSIPILQLISVVMMLLSARGQGLTDSLLGTTALNRRAQF